MDKERSRLNSKRLIVCILLSLTLIAGMFVIPAMTSNASSDHANPMVANAKSKKAKKKYKKETRGLWIAFCDFQDMGLYNKNKRTFTRNLNKALNKAKKNGVNTIYWHARAFDDATWKSKTFKASEYLTKKATPKKSAAKTYSYDPLKIVVKQCKKRGLKVEAWLNPYRITYEQFLDPASAKSTARIQRAVKELKKYKLNGIHMDDYFYNSSTGKYITPTKATRYKLNVKGTVRDRSALAPAMKRANVNRMVKSVYKSVHKKKKLKFGISPAGNVDNCMNVGADVKTWLKKKGYADYVAPQIYWSDNWGEDGTVTMFSDRLNQWCAMKRHKKVKLYIGLALYKSSAAPEEYSDCGWSKQSTNIRNQVAKLRQTNANGYILFEGNNVYAVGSKESVANMKNAAKELQNLKAYLKKTKTI